MVKLVSCENKKIILYIPEYESVKFGVEFRFISEEVIVYLSKERNEDYNYEKYDLYQS